ncbi:MAG TPA: hypothetical protein VGL76_02775 [Gaiellaceae bacterium]
MRLILIVAALGLLTGVGVAVAHDGHGGKTVAAASATFTATTAGNARTETCTGSDGNAYATTRGTWTGTSTGDSNSPSLTGNATIDATAVVNTTTGYGTVSGRIRIDGTSGGHVSANFDAVDTNGVIAGLAEGHGSPQGGQLVANLSASFAPTGTATGFTNGKLGGGTTGGNAAFVTSGGCQPQQPQKPDTIKADGIVSAVSATSITAANTTCAIPSNLTSTVAGLNLTVGSSTVDMKCVAANGTNTLQSINADKGPHGDDKHGPRHH